MSTVLKVEDVTVRFAGLVALSGVSFDIGAGVINAIIGPNGAGKSTLFGTISGYVRPASGRLLFLGESLVRASPPEIARKGLRRSFQNGGVFPQLTVLENVLTGLPDSWRYRLLPNALSLPSARRSEARAINEAEETMERMGIAALRDRFVGELPAGQQRLVEISRAIVGKSKLLLLDEPAVGLTLAELDMLAGVLRQLAADGMSILLVEHVIDFVLATASRVLVLNYGRLIADGVPDAIRSNEAVVEAYLGRR